jgi:catechol 2,3-dioxygenase-like lactoylglutathione lyase family enzyme
MNLAKQHLDVGLFSNKRDEQLAFWQQAVGLPYDHMGKLGGGMQQHRHHMNGSILKMNHARGPLPDAPPSGIVGLEIAREGLEAPRQLADPDGNKVTLVPKGANGIEGIAILLRVNDPAAHDRFWTHVMQFERVSEGRYRCGDSLVVVAEHGKVESAAGQWRGPGYRYMTVQVWDCLAEYHGILERGGTSGGEPRVLGDTVRFAFVCDPDGNHIEISQRASLTGSLEPGS